MSDSESPDKNDPKSSNDEHDAYQEESKMEEIFPWQRKFNELCRAAVGSKSMKMLENLLTVYLQKGSKTVHDCYMKPNRAGKLKKCMSDALVFFHLFYQDIKESFENSTYLEKMTELMAMYLDIEIKASRRRKEHVKKVVCRLTSALNIFLDHSENHILDVLIRAKFINKNYREICSPVLGKLLTSLRVYPMNDTLYVRYLLVFKLWKKVVADADERKNINKIAIQNLPAPSNFMERYKRFNNVLPRVPNSMNVTTFYMQAKFNLKTACQAFMKISKDPQQPIMSDKPLFFEGRLASSQSTFSGKANAFECGVSRNLMNDIWSIAEPATSQKKSDGDEGTKKKAKDKPKKKTKDWFDKERKKNGKNKTILFGNFRGNNSPPNVPQVENVETPTKDPVAVAVAIAMATKPATVEILPAVEVATASVETSEPPHQAQPVDTKPLIHTLTPQLHPDTKPLVLKSTGVDLTPPDIPTIHLTPPAEEVAKKETPAPSCQMAEEPVAPGSILFSGQLQEEKIAAAECDSTVEEPMEVVKPRDLIELMPQEEVPPPDHEHEFLDHEQDIVNEVTIATSELDISVRDNSIELPVYLQCHKEVVVETLDQASPMGSEDSPRMEEEEEDEEEEEVVAEVVEVPSVIVPPSGFKPCFPPPSHSPEPEPLVVEPLPIRDNFKFAIPSPPRLVQDHRTFAEVKPEMGPPPDDLSFSKEAPPIDEELVPDWSQLPFGFFQTNNNSDLFLECMDMRSFELDPAIDPVVDPRVIDPRMLEQPIKRRASEEFSHYPRMYVEPRSRNESVMPPQEFLADDYSPFTTATDHFPYYNARDLYGNYNPNPFFEEPVSQTPSRVGSNRKQVPTGNVESDAPPCNTVDYSSGSLNSSNNSILSACGKDNVARHCREARVPSNSDNNYYRETDLHKSQEELTKTEPVASAKVSILKPTMCNSSVDKHSPKNVCSNPHRKTPHPVSVQQERRTGVGYTTSPTAADCKGQLQEGSTPPKSAFRGGMFLGGTGRPIHYVSVGVPIPIAIPYSAASRHGLKCTCEKCFRDAQEYLFPNALAQGFNPSGLKTRADELKHQDDQILKKIEESMKEAAVKESPQTLDCDGSEPDNRSKPEMVSSLPPKKRHKLSSDLSESTPPEGFPNFGVRPMMSILSLQPGVSNSPITLQENNSNHNNHNGNHVKDVTNTSTKPNVPNVELNQLQQPNNVSVVKQAQTIPTNTARYSQQEMDETEINSRKRDEVIANYWEKKGIPQKKPGSDGAKSGPVLEKEPVAGNNRQYKPSQPSRTYPAPTKTHVNVNYADPPETVKRQFKTPAQLKELPLNRDLHYCFPYNCPLHSYGNWNQTAAESMILHRESYVPQPPPVYRMTDPAKAPATEQKSEKKRSSSSQRRPSSSGSSAKRTRCSNRKSQSGSGTGDSSEPKRKRKDNSR